ncbi:DL-endopeptidase inhibitor IseA family protein [Peribacillus sp. SCS-37]|uniref:DL-endopeptidase inhibitor IseA family protein n=1 Tax=Paraperibacillus esterisolvens TaxID=3115296 RepID=UPI003906269A
MNKKINDDFLEPLRTRPGLSADRHFRRHLKYTLLSSSVEQGQTRKHLHWLPNLLTAVVLLAGLFIGSEVFLKEKAATEHEKPAQDSAATKELSEKTAEKTLVAAYRHMADLNDSGKQDNGGGSTFQQNGAQYRFLSRPFNSREKILSYLEEVFTKKRALEMYEQHGFFKKDGRMAQPDSFKTPALLWEGSKVIEITPHGNEGWIAAYEIPSVSEGKEFEQVDITLHYDNGWKVNAVLQFWNEAASRNDGRAESVDPAPFILTQKEKEAYSAFSKDLDEEHLRFLDPISIARLYGQSILDERRDLTYALYTDREGFVQWSWEEHKNFPETKQDKNKTRSDYASLSEGEFIRTGDYQGFIRYQTPDGEMGFQMVRDEDGIWNASFTPIQ